MTKKGLSPVIATLLLVAIVISLSTIVFIWARGFIKEAVQKNGMPAEQACEGINLVATYSSGRLQISNNGDVPVHKFTASIKNENGDIVPEDYDEAIVAGDSIDVSVSTAGIEMDVIPWILGESKGKKSIYKCVKTFAVDMG